MPMKIAIASGKGGTGKTTIAVNLAHLFSQQGHKVAYLDCDVEAPNGHIFLKPQLTGYSPATTLIPQIDLGRCIHCGKCGRICQFNALLCLPEKVVTFPEMCHACGACSLVCPAEAITEIPREIGSIDQGMAGSIIFARGLLNIGEVMSPPLIRALKSKAEEGEVTIIDAPPGTSCPVIESIRDCDYVVLVTEPTPFGLNDLELAVEVVRALDLSFCVVVNRAGLNDQPMLDFCTEQNILVLAQLPDDRRVAEAYSRGQLICEALPDFKARFFSLMAAMETAILGRQIKSSERSNP